MSERFTVYLDELIDSPHWQGFVGRVKGRCAVANGCFDILHPGHLSLLATLDTEAYRRGLYPIVAINSDHSIKRIKGEGRPVVPQASRSKLLNNLKWPFTVVVFDDETPQQLMDFLQPALVVKGSEYMPGSVVRWIESEVLTVTMVDGWSTSKILGDTR